MRETTSPTQPEIVFPLDEYAARLLRVRRRMEARGLDVLLVSSPENIYYLSGHRTAGYYAFGCLLVPTAGDVVIVVRHLEATNAARYSWVNSIASVHDMEDPIAVTGLALSDLHLSAASLSICGVAARLKSCVMVLRLWPECS